MAYDNVSSFSFLLNKSTMVLRFKLTIIRPRPVCGHLRYVDYRPPEFIFIIRLIRHIE